jgi:MoaA/NifB/PqqE/SkfB family radical SAM enzyme
MLKSAVWFITEKCNYKCPYCFERDILTEFDAPVTGDFVIAWNRLKPEILDITGGEPFLVPNFINILEQLDSSIKIAITTNLSLDLTKFVTQMTPERVISMTLSLHPTMVNFDVFTGKVIFLKNRGFNITVNFVTYPEQMWLISTYMQRFTNLGIRFHVDYYVCEGGAFNSFDYSEQEKTFLSNYVQADRKHFTEAPKAMNCSAGIDHIQVYPDGTAFRCMKDMLTKKEKMGNILDENFKLKTEYGFCDDVNKCAGCDKDKVLTEALKVELV